MLTRKWGQQVYPIEKFLRLEFENIARSVCVTFLL